MHTISCLLMFRVQGRVRAARTVERKEFSLQSDWVMGPFFDPSIVKTC